MTNLLYFLDSKKLTCRSHVISVLSNELGYYIILDKTIFHPKGGGQPSDIGHLSVNNLIVPIKSAQMINGKVYHYIDQYYDIKGAQIDCFVNLEVRSLHSKLHTGGHLIADIISHSKFKPIKGHHYPNEAYIEFKGAGNIDIDYNNRIILDKIEQDLTISTILVNNNQAQLLLNSKSDIEGDIKLVKIGDYAYQACSGTHIQSTKELAGLRITKTKIKGDILKVKYTFDE